MAEICAKRIFCTAQKHARTTTRNARGTSTRNARVCLMLRVSRVQADAYIFAKQHDSKQRKSMQEQLQETHAIASFNVTRASKHLRKGPTWHYTPTAVKQSLGVGVVRKRSFLWREAAAASCS